MKKGQLSTKHGHCYHPLYNVWLNIKRRCLNPSHPVYHRYGGRGIKVCDKWLSDFGNFYAWAINKWEKGLQIDRIDNNGNYDPNNCRFVTSKQNNSNREHCVYIKYKNKTKMIHEWAAELNISASTIYRRYKRGLPPKYIFIKPKIYNYAKQNDVPNLLNATFKRIG